MPILEFRAYRLERYNEGAITVNEDGDSVKDLGTWSYVCDCNAVPAGRMSQISLPDGQIEAYSYTLNLPFNAPDFKYGDIIRLSFMGHEFQQLTVKGFHRYQHQSKIWA